MPVRLGSLSGHACDSVGRTPKRPGLQAVITVHGGAGPTGSCRAMAWEANAPGVQGNHRPGMGRR